MKITIKFKHLPRSGKTQQWTGKRMRYFVRYNTKGNVHTPGNVTHDYRLPKLIWGLLA